MAAEHWFRWHHGTVTDPKWRVIAQRATDALSRAGTGGHAMSRNVTAGHVVSVWAAMLECASQANPRGTLDGWDDEDTAAALDFEPEMVRAIRESMQKKTLDGDELKSWKRRQPKAEDATSTARKRRQRAREKEEADDDPESACHGMSRNVTTETETETETEKKKEPPNPPSVEKPKRKSAVTFATWIASIPKGVKAIPADHHVFAYAERVGLPHELLVLAWRWFERRYADEPKRYRDWPAVFRKAVEGNWGKLWFLDPDGHYSLTTVGKQFERSLRAAA